MPDKCCEYASNILMSVHPFVATINIRAIESGWAKLFRIACPCPFSTFCFARVNHTRSCRDTSSSFLPYGPFAATTAFHACSRRWCTIDKSILYVLRKWKWRFYIPRAPTASTNVIGYSQVSKTVSGNHLLSYSSNVEKKINAMVINWHGRKKVVDVCFSWSSFQESFQMPMHAAALTCPSV